ncbi:aconitate hydratase [Wolbachia endosymbiont of Pentidionis agamae]|uniref:aconitate hydratase n=1 Tax=Wolbachia endosymbiont of Pentidionis agamae TaxID=3110435 RepID=UPI002FD69234
MDSKATLNVDGKLYNYFSLKSAANFLGLDINRLPCSLKILAENLLRNQSTKLTDIVMLANSIGKHTNHEISYKPARVLMQDFTGVPAVVDLASMRSYVKNSGGNPSDINPSVPVDLVIDHSVQVDSFGRGSSLERNIQLEIERNLERYQFLKWGESSFRNFRVVPPGTGICHQVNLEYLAQVVCNENGVIYPDTVIGTDSHTTMINGLSVLGWGVGGIEAESVMLGQPINMVIPEVVGFKLLGKLSDGVTATDLVLTITNILRTKGVVGKFVEFYGDGLDDLSIADRATIANMAPEYGATCGFFPIDQKTLDYLYLTGRTKKLIRLVEVYSKEQGLWRSKDENISFFSKLELDLCEVEPVMAGPKRPQDKVLLSQVPKSFSKSFTTSIAKVFLSQMAKSLSKTFTNSTNQVIEDELSLDDKRFLEESQISDTEYVDESASEQNNQMLTKKIPPKIELCDNNELQDGSIVIAAITSCTNTSNPYVMIAAGLVAQSAVKLGIKPKEWVKTSLAPGSKVVTEYLEKSGLQESLNAIGFNLVGYGCTTCIGNSGPLSKEIEDRIKEKNLTVASILSGNRNFEGRIHSLVKANYLASPPLVVAYALAGTVRIDLTKDPICKDKNGDDVYLKNIWPKNYEIEDYVNKVVTREAFIKKYKDVFSGDEHWKKIKCEKSQIYNWNINSNYIQNPPYFDNLLIKKDNFINIENAQKLAVFGDSITTDHISPAGSINLNSSAGIYLKELGVKPKDFNSYGSRRGNHNVMMRGTFANIRIKNEMVDVEGGYTRYVPSGEIISIFDAAMRYKKNSVPLIVIAGKEYGTGSSRDWAAKGTSLLGVKAVIAESFERIHRSNLVGMGVLPLVFQNNMDRRIFDDSEGISITGKLGPCFNMECIIHKKDKLSEIIELKCLIETISEVEYLLSGGLLSYILKNYV